MDLHHSLFLPSKTNLPNLFPEVEIATKNMLSPALILALIEKGANCLDIQAHLGL